eukprot:336247_1
MNVSAKHFSRIYMKFKRWKLNNYSKIQITNEIKDNHNISDDNDTKIEENIDDDCETIKNPVVVSIGVSKYEKLSSLPGCKKDVQTILDLFVNKCGYNLHPDLHTDDQTKFGLKKEEILSIFNKAQKIIIEDASENKEDNIDGLIIAFSGHGGPGYIYGSDYDPKADIDGKPCGKIGIVDIQQIFTLDEFRVMPKIMIIDACRGGKGTDKDMISTSKTARGVKTENKKLNAQYHHEMANWFCIYSTPMGYKSYEEKQGGVLVNSIATVFKMPKCFDGEWNLTKISRKIRLEALRLTKKDDVENDGQNKSKSRQCVAITETIVAEIFFKKGTFAHNYTISYINDEFFTNYDEKDNDNKDDDGSIMSYISNKFAHFDQSEGSYTLNILEIILHLQGNNK